MQGRDGCWGPGRHRLQLTGRPSATPKPDGYMQHVRGHVPALVRPPAARSPEPQPVSPTLSPPSPSAAGWQRPWARGHGQPGVSWRRSQLLLPVLRAFSGSLTRPSKSGGPVRRQARRSPCSGLAATAASSRCSSQRRASAEGGEGGPAQPGAAVRGGDPSQTARRRARRVRAGHQGPALARHGHGHAPTDAAAGAGGGWGEGGACRLGVEGAGCWRAD